MKHTQDSLFIIENYSTESLSIIKEVNLHIQILLKLAQQKSGGGTYLLYCHSQETSRLTSLIVHYSCEYFLMCHSVRRENQII